MSRVRVGIDNIASWHAKGCHLGVLWLRVLRFFLMFFSSCSSHVVLMVQHASSSLYAYSLCLMFTLRFPCLCLVFYMLLPYVHLAYALCLPHALLVYIEIRLVACSLASL